MADEITRILNGQSREALISYIRHLASTDRDVMMDILERFSVQDSSPSLEFLKGIITRTEDDYSIMEKYPSSKASASFSRKIEKRIQEITDILLSSGRNEDLGDFLLWMTERADSYALACWNNYGRNPISDIEEKLDSSFHALIGNMDEEERVRFSGKAYGFLSDSSIEFNRILNHTVGRALKDSTDDETLLHGLLQLLQRSTRSMSPEEIDVEDLEANCDLQYLILKKLGYGPDEIRRAMNYELHYGCVINLVADHFKAEEKWRDAYRLYMRLYENMSGRKTYSYTLEENAYLCAYNGGLQKEFAPYLIRRMEEGTLISGYSLTRLQNLVGIDETIGLLPRLLENKSLEAKLSTYRAYGLVENIAETLEKSGLAEDLVKYHEDIAGIDRSMLERIYMAVIDRSIEMKKSSANYYEVLDILYNLPLTSGKAPSRLRNQILDHLLEKYPKRTALIEIIGNRRFFLDEQF